MKERRMAQLEERGTWKEVKGDGVQRERERKENGKDQRGGREWYKEKRKRRHCLR